MWVFGILGDWNYTSPLVPASPTTVAARAACLLGAEHGPVCVQLRAAVYVRIAFLCLNGWDLWSE